ncbi:hypothetical protein ACFLRW_03520 [Acidobacteriota bacterium]
MKKVRNFKFFSLGCILAIALILIGVHVLQAQMKTQAKGGKPKPPPPPPIELPCNNNEVCEISEVDDSLLLEEQPCPDCAPKDYAPLNTILPGTQIISKAYGLGNFLQFQYVEGEYIDTWASQPLLLQDYFVADIDNDNIKEIVAVSNTVFSNDAKKKKDLVRWSQQKIHIYRHGNQGTPDYTSGWYGSIEEGGISWIILADADGDGIENELIWRRDDKFEIHRWNGADFMFVWASVPYPDLFMGVDVGDVDGEGANEIVAGTNHGQVLVIEHLGGNNWGEALYTEEVTAQGPFTDHMYIDYVCVADVDNDGVSNEIVAGGSNARIMVWKYNVDTEAYETACVSEPFEGFTEQGSVGDFDGDGTNEIVFLAKDSGIYISDLVPSGEGSEYPYNLGFVSFLEVENYPYKIFAEDSDNDGWDEVLYYNIDVGGVILDYDGFNLTQTIASAYLYHPIVK